MRALPPEAPIGEIAAQRAIQWLKTTFGIPLVAQTQGTPFTVDHLCGIACQETAYFWVNLLGRLPDDQVCARCVLDGSGDFEPDQNPRSAFPRNTGEFRSCYDRSTPGFTEMLIGEGNQTRSLRGMSPADWIYKGYGIFQYDLQFVKTDMHFFYDRLWYRFENCLARAMRELTRNWRLHSGDLFAAIKAYNGCGPSAEIYAQNVLAYSGISVEVAALATAVDPSTGMPA